MSTGDGGQGHGGERRGVAGRGEQGRAVGSSEEGNRGVKESKGEGSR